MPSGDSDNVYSIGVSNKFDMIDSDMFDDPSELIRAAQEKPKKEKEPKVKGKKVDVKPAKTTEKKTMKTESTTENENSENKRNDRPRNERGRGRGRGRGGRGGERGERGGRGRGGFRNNNYSSNNNNQGGFGFDNNNQGGFGSYQTQVAETNEGGFGSIFGGNDGEERRGGRSGFRGGRGGRGGRGRGRGGNREFDRRSGSDKSSVKPADKRDGSGSYNWGSPQDEINAASEENGGFGAPKETEETPAENVEQTPETEETPEVEPVDEGPQEMTFEEYKKHLSESRKQPEFNLRKVDSDKKGLKQLKKPTEKDNESSSSFFFPKKSIQETYKTSGRVKESLNVDIRYGSGDNRHYDASRRGRGRGGRRGGRRDGEGNTKDSGFALANDEEFPSL